MTVYSSASAPVAATPRCDTTVDSFGQLEQFLNEVGSDGNPLICVGSEGATTWNDDDDEILYCRTVCVEGIISMPTPPPGGMGGISFAACDEE